MTAKTAAFVFGVIFVLVGVLGYLDVAGIFANPVVGDDPAAIFLVNDMHNYVHLGVGAVLIILAVVNLASIGLILFGVVYGVVAVLGFVAPDVLGGMIAMNMNDHYLHVGLAIVLLLAGFLLPKGGAAAAPAAGT
jgi:hypothetical protein